MRERLGDTLLIPEQVAQIKMGLEEIGRNLERLFILSHRLSNLALLLQSVTQVIMGGAILGTKM